MGGGLGLAMPQLGQMNMTGGRGGTWEHWIKTGVVMQWFLVVL